MDHVLELWHVAYVRANAAAQMISKYAFHSTKASYIGLHLLHQPDIGTKKRVYDQHKNAPSRVVIEPNSTFKETWDSLILFFILYTATIVPFRIAFVDIYEENVWNYLFLVVDIIADLVFGVDIIINFLTAYEKPDGTWEYGQKNIAQHYLAGFFVIDLLAIIPYGPILAAATGDKENFSVYRWYRLVKLIRLAKLSNLGNFTAKVQNFII